MTPEFSRPERFDSIGEEERRVSLVAAPAECDALARRFDLVAVERLEATLTVRREAAGFAVHGRVTAAVVQACTITGDPLPVTMDEPVALRFVTPGGGTDDVELATDALDTVEIEGNAIDLGEAVAETMALGLDPYPRGPNAASMLRAAGVMSEDEAKPAGPFADLRAKLERR